MSFFLAHSEAKSLKDVCHKVSRCRGGGAGVWTGGGAAPTPSGQPHLGLCRGVGGNL